LLSCSAKFHFTNSYISNLTYYLCEDVSDGALGKGGGKPLLCKDFCKDDILANVVKLFNLALTCCSCWLQLTYLQVKSKKVYHNHICMKNKNIKWHRCQTFVI